MKKGVSLLPYLSASAIIIYQLVWFSLLTSLFDNTIYALGITLATFAAGLSMGGYIDKFLNIRIGPTKSSIYAQIAVGIYGIFILYFLKNALFIYNNIFSALTLIIIFLALHSIIGGSIIWKTRSDGLQWAPVLVVSIVVLTAGFIFIPAFGLYPAILFAAALNMTASLFYKQRENEVENPVGKIQIDVFFIGLLISFYVALLLLSFPQNETLFFLPTLFVAFIWGIEIEISLKKRDFFQTQKIDTALLILFAALALILLADVTKGLSIFYILPTTFFLTLPSWILAINLAKKSLISALIGASIGFLSSLFLITPSKGPLILAIVMTLALGLSILNLRKGKNQKMQVLTSISALVITVYVAFLPLQISPITDISPLAYSFSTHIPFVLKPDGVDRISSSISYMGSKNDALILGGDAKEEGFYILISQRLGQNGILVQTSPLAVVSEENFKKMIKSTMNTFPHSTLWLVQDNGIVVSSKGSLKLDYLKIRERMLENKDVKDDMNRLFNATKFNNLTVLDSFALLYFMSEQELFDYAHFEGVENENAFQSIFNFKRFLSNSTSAISRPPLINGVTRNGKDIKVDFLGLRAEIGEDWRIVPSITARRILIENGTDYGLSYEKGVEFVQGSTVIGLQAYQSRVTSSLELSQTVLELLDEEVRLIGISNFDIRGYEITEAFEDTVGAYNRYFFFGGREGHDAKAISMVWYCNENESINSVTVDYLEEDPVIEEILLTISCL